MSVFLSLYRSDLVFFSDCDHADEYVDVEYVIVKVNESLSEVSLVHSFLFIRNPFIRNLALASQNFL